MNRKNNFTILVFLFVVLSAQAQTFRHPYSIYGIGKLLEPGFITNMSMGGTGIAWSDRFSVTPLNPASYSNLEFTSFDIALSSSTINLRQDTNSYYNTYSNFGYFSLGFPLFKKHGWGAAIGMAPISNIGYMDKFSFMDAQDSALYQETFDISGGFSKFYAGASFRFFHHLNIGVNMKYIFGNVDRTHLLEFLVSDYNSLSEEIKKNFGQVGFDFGFQYHTSIGDDKKLVVGATYDMPVNLNSNSSLLIQTYEYGGSYFKDSIRYHDFEKSTITLPMSLGAGLMLTRENHWRINVDYKLSRWSDFSGIDINTSLNDATRISVGGEYIPAFDDITNYSRRIAYRVGIKYAKSYLNVQNEAFQKYSFSFGAGFPINKDVSRINAGFEFGRLASSNTALISENFFSVMLGFRLNDIWFRKPKID